MSDTRLGLRRLAPLDDWRGLLMVVMALDHANTFVADGKAGVEWWLGLPAYGDNVLQFLTRWVTHIAAPGFFFLMGAGVVLLRSSRLERGWSEARIAGHLVVRGVVLIALQFAVVNWAWKIDGAIPISQHYVGVLAALGASMILVTPALRLSWPVPAALGGALLILAELVLPGTVTPIPGGPPAIPLFGSWEVLLVWPGFSSTFLVLYSLVSVLGLTLLGVGFGRALVDEEQATLAMATRLGLGALAGFVLVRALGGFGNVTMPPDTGWIGFLNVTKYPFSITFVLLTLGLGLVFLDLRVGRRPSERAPLQVFGRTALFFYVIHLFLYGILGQVVGKPTGIPVMYPWFLVGLAILYPLCRWYDRFKRTQPASSIWRLF